MPRGKYIVIEGMQGVGKTTMVERLAEQLRSVHLPVKIWHEPDFQNDAIVRAIEQLTRDPRYVTHSRAEALLRNAARSQSAQSIRQLADTGVICLVDRSYLSILTLQYYGQGDVQDYQNLNNVIDFALGDIQPDLMLVLDVPVATLRERTKGRAESERFQTLDDAFLERVRAGYLWEAKQRSLPVVYANEDTDTVFKAVWQHVSAALAVRGKDNGNSKTESVAEVLAANPPTKVATAVEPPITTTLPQQAPEPNLETPPPVQPVNPEALVTTSPVPVGASHTPAEPWTQEHNDTSRTVTAAGQIELAKYITNANGTVYGFTQNVSPVTVAAAMARFSRSDNDLRVTLLDEFIGKAGENEQSLQHIIAAYGDDSVQQLVGQHFVVEGASMVLTKKLEWGRLATYLEQPMRYIDFGQKDERGRYRYVVPAQFKGKLRAQYIDVMNAIFDLYSHMAKTLTEHVRRTSTTPKADQDAAQARARDILHDVLPLAIKATVGMFVSGQALESLIVHLLSDALPEARATGELLLAEARKTIPAFLEQADKPESGGATIAYRATTQAKVRQLAETLLPHTHTGTAEPITLTTYSPHNELDIVADMLYECSDLPLHELQQQVATWPYRQKVDVFTAYMGERLNRRQRPGRALEKIHYSFDLVAKYGAFKDLQRHRMVDDLAWQEFTPRLGYDIPKLVEDAGLVEQFERCFELSLQLYSVLQASKHPQLAQYAVLHGHNVRWKVTLNAREAFQMLERRSNPQSHSAHHALVKQMHAKIAEVHPLLAEAIMFVNKDEDPELARLAAERYTQYKLNLLDNKQTKGQQ
ncbi:MAG TPA: FAD-dependent thymidylate synthase [Candidatus Saccharimonadales bacterium]|nr:FAD-dependent thymidylate synthase [Candidatus Saccharimonadales bacterium]